MGKNNLILIMVFSGAALCVIGVVVWYDSPKAPVVKAPAAEPGRLLSNSDGTDRVPDSPRAADVRMQELSSAADRITHLNWISRQQWARSDLPVLRKTIVGDLDEEVQLEAIEVALKLASKEGRAATSEVVRVSLASRMGNTRARGLKAAKLNPDPALVPDMIELIDGMDPYAAMALNVLAFADSASGDAKIMELASNDEADPKLRQRAIALLAHVEDRAAMQILGDLANDEDETLRRLAKQVIDAVHDRR